MINRIRAFARRHDLWRPDTRVVAAVSGGSDSVALLFLLRDLAAEGDFILDSIAHLNHQIRGEAALADESFCAALAARVSLPFLSARVDVPARAAAARQSIELAARIARQEFYRGVLRQRGADRVATAHTLDDQAETVLLRVIRGAGLQGLAGIHPRRTHLIRPLLDCRRQDLRNELHGRGESWREDQTNQDLVHARNRMRHVVLPYLANHFNPAVAEALARVADVTRPDDAWLQREADHHASGLISTANQAVQIDATGLVALSTSLARRVARRALETVDRTRSYRLDEVDLVRAVASGDVGAAEVSGIRMERFGRHVVLQKRDLVQPPAPFCYELSIPGAVEQVDGSWRLEASGPLAAAELRSPDAVGAQVVVEAARLTPQLLVRSRRPGDRLRPLGLGGAKKLQDLFVDRKVRREERDRMPIVTDTNGQIIWVPGHALAEEFRVTERTNAVVVLKLRPSHPPSTDCSPAVWRKAEGK